MNFQFINNSVWSVIAKVVSSLLGFATVAILLKSLGPAQYGVWVLLTSFMGWAGFLDLGVSNGIRNRLSQAFVSEDQNLARRLISTGFATSVLFASTFVGLYFVATGVFDLSRIFEGGGELRSAAVLALNLCVIGALSRYVLSLIQIILTVRHKVKIAENLNAITSLLFFLAVMLQADLKNIDLFSTAVTFGICSIVPLLLANCYYFNKDFRKFSPQLGGISFTLAKSFIAPGSGFFIIQISAVLMFSTDALIITKLFGPETLASYSLVVKLFGGIQIIWGAILGPLWPAIAHALSSRDSKWVQDSVKPLAQAFTGFVTVSILLYFCIPFIIFHWVGEIKIPDLVPEVLLAQTILQGFNAILASYMYAADRVWLVARTGVFSGAINIPLSIFFATSLGFGVAGVVLGTLVSMSVFTFIGSRLFMSDLRKKFEI